MLARAPLAANRPLQTSRLTMSLSMASRSPLGGRSIHAWRRAGGKPRPGRSTRLQAVADRRRDKSSCLLEVGVGRGEKFDNPPRHQLLDRTLEAHRRDARADD